VICGAAAATLTGLLFVAVSIRIASIARSQELRNREAQTLSLFGMVRPSRYCAGTGCTSTGPVRRTLTGQFAGSAAFSIARSTRLANGEPIRW
jgi:hypothetical protein